MARWSARGGGMVTGQIDTCIKLTKRMKIAHSFFTVCVRSVPHYHFKLAYVILQMAVKEFFETYF